MRSTKINTSTQIETSPPSYSKTYRGVFKIEVPDTDEEWLLWALNHPLIDRNVLWGNEEFCERLRQLTAEVKDQYRLAKAGRPPKEFLALYEQHRRMFQQIQFEKYLLPTYGVMLTLSSRVDEDEDEQKRNDKQKQNKVLSVLIDLMQNGELDYLRQCANCGKWYVAAKSDQKVCSLSCRQKKFRGNEKYNAQRRENYALKKRLKRIRKNTKRKGDK